MRGKSKQSDTSIVVMKRANKEGDFLRSPWSEGMEPRGIRLTDRTQSRITDTGGSRIAADYLR